MSDKLVSDYDVLTRFLKYSEEEAKEILAKVSEARVADLKKKAEKSPEKKK